MQQKHNISEKAYAHFTSHIRSVFSLIGQGTARVVRAIRALNEYIEGSRHDFDDLLGIPEVRLALMMIQPEIDKCLARSAAARARAHARKEARRQQAPEPERPCENRPADEAKMTACVSSNLAQIPTKASGLGDIDPCTPTRYVELATTVPFRSYRVNS